MGGMVPSTRTEPICKTNVKWAFLLIFEMGHLPQQLVGRDPTSIWVGDHLDWNVSHVIVGVHIPCGQKDGIKQAVLPTNCPRFSPRCSPMFLSQKAPISTI